MLSTKSVVSVELVWRLFYEILPLAYFNPPLGSEIIEFKIKTNFINPTVKLF